MATFGPGGTLLALSDAAFGAVSVLLAWYVGLGVAGGCSSLA